MDSSNLVALAPLTAGVMSALVNVLRWAGDRTIRQRQRQEVAYATELAKFIQFAPEVSSVGNAVAEGQRAVESARDEIKHSLLRLQTLFERQRLRRTPPPEMSIIRRLLMFYAVPNWRAAFLQALFLVALVYLALIGVAVMVPDSEPTFPLPPRFLAVALVPFFALVFYLRLWAETEARTEVEFSPPRKNLDRALLWYMPVNRRDLLARVLLVESLLALIFWALRSVGAFSFPDFYARLFPAIPHWQMLYLSCAHVLAVPLAYFWAQAEREARVARVHSGPRFPHNLRFLYPPARRSELASLILFWVFVIGFVITVATLRLPTLDMIPADDRAPFQAGLVSALIWNVVLSFVAPYGAYRWGLIQFRLRPAPSESKAAPLEAAQAGTGGV